MDRFQDLRRSEAFAALLAASAGLGRDPLQVQGPGGNTSLKARGAMWIKASGAWLAEAQSRDIMAPVETEMLTEALVEGAPEQPPMDLFVPAGQNPDGLRVSIETAVHAALGWPVVLHTHCVATIALAIRRDAEAEVARRLGSLDPCFVPYVKPGWDLARAIHARATPQTRVLILGNHGLVVCAQIVAEAEALLRDVSARLSPAEVRPAIPAAPGFEDSLRGAGWQVSPDPVTHAIAQDPERLRMAGLGTLYPDHVIFLGPGVAVAEPGEPVADTAARAPRCKVILVPGQGAAGPTDATPAMLAMARCLCDVLARVPVEAPLAAIPPADEAALMNWDAEKHRQALNAARPSP